MGKCFKGGRKLLLQPSTLRAGCQTRPSPETLSRRGCLAPASRSPSSRRGSGSSGEQSWAATAVCPPRPSSWTTLSRSGRRKPGSSYHCNRALGPQTRHDTGQPIRQASGTPTVDLKGRKLNTEVGRTKKRVKLSDKFVFRLFQIRVCGLLMFCISQSRAWQPPARWLERNFTKKCPMRLGKQWPYHLLNLVSQTAF